MSSDVGQHGAKFCGICDRCKKILVFSSAEERDVWERTHPHEEDE